MSKTVELFLVQAAHVKALDAAQKASQAFADKYFNGGDGGACGFAWVNCHKVRSNSSLGKALSEIGFRKSYQGGLQQWNRWWMGQSVDAAEHGAMAYARVMQEELKLDFFAGSRLD